MNIAYFNYILQFADNVLILGHRNSEWCGHGPVLEQDIAISNIALDLLGQARNFYQYAATIFNELDYKDKALVFTSPLLQEKILLTKNIDEDHLAYLRDQQDYKNILMNELPKGHWGFTIVRQFLFSSFQKILFEQWLHVSKDHQLKAIFTKSLKEIKYHLQWSGDWVLRLGDGTAESNLKTQEALDELWQYCNEFFMNSEYEKDVITQHNLVSNGQVQEIWYSEVYSTLKQANLIIPDTNSFNKGNGKIGIHTEHLSYLLGEMQVINRSFPNSTW